MSRSLRTVATVAKPPHRAVDRTRLQNTIDPQSLAAQSVGVLIGSPLCVAVSNLGCSAEWRIRVANATADQLRTELRTALLANTHRLCDAIRAELARDMALEPGHRMQFEVDPCFYGISSCVSEETVLVDWLDNSLPSDWYERADEALGGWDALVSEELCPWFAESWLEVGGPQQFSPAFLFFHDYHNQQYDLEARRWLSGKALDEVWDRPNT